MSRARSLTAWSLIAALTTGIGACSNGDDPSASRPPATTTTVMTPAVTQTTVQVTEAASSDAGGVQLSEADIAAELAADGLAIVADESVQVTSPLTLTRWQAGNLATGIPLDGQPAGGLLGSELDAIAPLPVGSPPMSYLLAAWVSTGTSAAARRAQAWMGDADWRHAPQLVFPVPAVAMFVAEMAAATDRELPPIDAVATSATGPMGFARGPAQAAQGVCSTVQGLLSGAIGALFGALRLQPVSGGTFFDDVVSTLVDIWNVAVGLAQGIVQGLVDAITAPIFAAIRTGVAALGVASLVLSNLSHQVLTMRVAPTPGADPYYRFSVGDEPPVVGQFLATAPSLTTEWPDALVDCARTAGATLPELVRPGSRADWTVEATPGNVISYAPGGGRASTAVGTDRTARLDFATGRETEEQAEGGAAEGWAHVFVRIPRAEIHGLLSILRGQVDAAVDQLASNIPAPVAGAPDLRAEALATYRQAVGPLTAEMDEAIAGATDGIFALNGAIGLYVQYHETTTTTSSTSSTTTTSTSTSTTSSTTTVPDQFCPRFLAGYVEPDGGIVAYGVAGVEFMNQLRPLAPSELIDEVDVALAMYHYAAAFDIQGVSDTAVAFHDAVLAMYGYCGVTPSGS